MRAIFSYSPQDRTSRLGLPILLVLFVLALSWQYAHKITSRPYRSAILRWQPQILALEAGTNIVQRHNYPNPPIMAILLYPLVKLPPLLAGLTWFYLKVGMTALALFWIFRLVETKERPFPFGAKLLAFGLSLRPLMGDLQHGNVNLFILFLVTAFLTLYRRRREGQAGIVLGLAIGCKITPALFVPYLIWKRSWRAVAGCIVGIALFLWPGFVPATFLGWDANERHLASWYDAMVRPFVVEGKVTSEQENQSLPGVAYRLATQSPSDSKYIGDTYVPTVYSNVVALDPATVRWFLRGCMALFAVMIVWRCRTPTEPREGWRLAAEYSLILLGMLLFSERTWKHHCVTLALPFSVLCYYLWMCSPSQRLRRGLIITLVAVALLMASTSSGLLPRVLSEEAQVYGAYVWAYVLLVVALTVVLRCPEKGTHLFSDPHRTQQVARS